MGRNPGMPWKTQSKLIEIDADCDFTSDQLLGDEPFRSKFDTRTERDLVSARRAENVVPASFNSYWSVLSAPSSWEPATGGILKDFSDTAWYRCTIRLTAEWIDGNNVRLQFPADARPLGVWLNGKSLKPPVPLGIGDLKKPLLSLLIPPKVFQPDDIHLLVLRIKHAPGDERK